MNTQYDQRMEVLERKVVEALSQFFVIELADLKTNRIKLDELLVFNAETKREYFTQTKIFSILYFMNKATRPLGFRMHTSKIYFKDLVTALNKVDTKFVRSL